MPLFERLIRRAKLQGKLWNVVIVDLYIIALH